VGVVADRTEPPLLLRPPVAVPYLHWRSVLRRRPGDVETASAHGRINVEEVGAKATKHPFLLGIAVARPLLRLGPIFGISVDDVDAAPARLRRKRDPPASRTLTRGRCAVYHEGRCRGDVRRIAAPRVIIEGAEDAHGLVA